MLDLIIKLQEKLSELVKIRDTQNKDFFNEFYRPTYESMISVHQNYVASAEILKAFIQDEPDRDELLAFIQKQRTELLSLRQHIIGVTTLFKLIPHPTKLSQVEIDFIHAVYLYMTSYFDGRTSFTGLKVLVDDIEDCAMIGGRTWYSIIERRHQCRTYKDYLNDELDRLVRWLEKHFSDISFIYNVSVTPTPS